MAGRTEPPASSWEIRYIGQKPLKSRHYGAPTIDSAGHSWEALGAKKEYRGGVDGWPIRFLKSIIWAFDSI